MRKHPEPAPGGPFFEQRPENPGKIGQDHLARRMLARVDRFAELLHRERAGRQKSTAVELLLHAAVAGEEGGTGKEGRKAAGLREGLSAARRVGRPDGKC